jgi:hypothetical protein
MIATGTQQGMQAIAKLDFSARRHGLLEQPVSPHPEAITEVPSRP